MCLYLDWQHYKTTVACGRYAAKRSKRKTAWKIADTHVSNRGVTYTTPNRMKPLSLGKMLVSNRRQIKLSRIEIASGQVDRGIHVFTTKKAARRAVDQYYRGCVIIRCRVRPCDHVSDGDEGTEAVYMQVLPLGS